MLPIICPRSGRWLFFVSLGLYFLILGCSAGSSSGGIQPVPPVQPAAPEQVLGAIDQAVDAVSFNNTVSQSDSLFVSGWSFSTLSGAPVKSVSVSIDGNAVGNATLDFPRSDIASAYGSAYLNSGYEFKYPASSLSLGSHSVILIAQSPSGMSSTLGPSTFSVVASSAQDKILGAIDQAIYVPAQTAAGTTGNSIVIDGWLVDTSLGAPLADITVFIDGAEVGPTQKNLPRPDIAAAYNNSLYLGAGFQSTIPVTAISAGTHQVTVTSTAATGASLTLGPINLVIPATLQLSPQSISFPSTKTGFTSSPQSVAIHNPGNAPLPISSIAIAGSNANDFAETSTCSAVLAASSTCVVQLTATASAVGSRNAVLSVASGSGTAQTVSLAAQGLDPSTSTDKASVALVAPSVLPVQVAAGSAGVVPIVVSPQLPANPSVVPTNGVYYEIHHGSSAVGVLAASGYNLQLSNGTAQIPVPASMASGTYTLLVSYNGDAAYQASAAPLLIGLQVGSPSPAVSFAPQRTLAHGTSLAGLMTASATAPTSVYKISQVNANYSWINIATPPSSQVLRLDGCAPSDYVNGSGSPRAYLWSCQTAQNYSRLYRVGTIVNSDSIDFILLEGKSHYRVWVDGVASGYFSTQPTASGAIDEYRVSFTDGKPHRFVLETDGFFGGFITPDGASDLSYPDWTLGRKIAYFSDSFGEPTITGNFNGFVGFLDTAMDMLGGNSYLNYSEGGADYIATDNGLRTNYLGHIANSDGCSTSFDAYVFIGGSNDSGASSSAEQTAASNTYQAALTCSPNASIFVFGPIPGAAQGYVAPIQQVDAGVQAAAAQMNSAGKPVYYIVSPGAQGWFTSSFSGCSGAPGDPVACTLSGDGTHPTQFWQSSLGATLGNALFQAAPALLSPNNQPTALASNAVSLVQHRQPEVKGLWTLTSGGTTVLGVGGDATTSLRPGDQINDLAQGGAVIYTVSSIVDDNTIVLTNPAPSYWNPGVAAPLQIATYPWATLSTSAATTQVPVAGSYSYTVTPTGGAAYAVTADTVLPIGTYTLSTTFTPTDLAAYSTTSASVLLAVTAP